MNYRNYYTKKVFNMPLTRFFTNIALHASVIFFLSTTAILTAATSSFKLNNVPFVSQNERHYFNHVSCGAAALMMLLLDARQREILDQSDLTSFRTLVDNLCISQHKGVFITDIINFLKKKNIRHHMVKPPENNIKLNLSQGPVAVRIDRPNKEHGHWIVLIGYNDEGYMYLDPNDDAQCTRIMKYSEFSILWKKNQNAIQLL